jgi:hypothetical protein
MQPVKSFKTYLLTISFLPSTNQGDVRYSGVTSFFSPSEEMPNLLRLTLENGRATYINVNHVLAYTIERE